MNFREHKDDLVTRAQALVALMHVALLVIAGGFWLTQVVHGERYREMAENNRLRKLPIKAPRGVIFDQHGDVLVDNAPSYDLTLDRTRTLDKKASLEFAARVLGRATLDLEQVLDRARTVPDFQPILLAKGLSLAQVSRFGVASLEHPEFEVDIGHQRVYRYAGQTAHVLGYLGEVNEGDLKDPQQGLLPGDLVGRRGIEAAYDRRLRGQDGERIVVVDSRGKALEELGRKVARPGQDLKLSIDLELQTRAASLLADKVGAIVALDPRTGEVRALASSPSYDSNLFTRPLTGAEWQALSGGEHHPLQNRAIQSRYSPGSVFKIVMGIAGLSEGLVSTGDTEFCGGSTTIYNHRYRCWKKGGHGTVDLHRAIKYSCDVYFYHLGKRLGIDRIAKHSRQLRLGRATGLDLGGEKSGLVPDEAWSLAARKHPWYAGETISVAIGQGPLLTTPLQIAGLLAAVANGGNFVEPRLVADQKVVSQPLGIDARALAAVRRGLWAVVNEADGTGRSCRLPGIEVAGKTGTVQVVTQKTWTNSDDLPHNQRDHAWFASFAPYDDPQLVVVVFLEHGGKGSSAAAPLAKALYETFFNVDEPEPLTAVDDE